MFNSKKPRSIFNYSSIFIVIIFSLSGCYSNDTSNQTETQSQSKTAAVIKVDTVPSSPRSVRGFMQARPGGPMAEVEVEVHQAPVDLPVVLADSTSLNDDDLVLGVVSEGLAVAYPIRFLAMYEIVDGQVGKTPVAPTW